MNRTTKTITVPSSISYEALERLLFPSRIAHVTSAGGIRNVTYIPCCEERKRDATK